MYVSWGLLAFIMVATARYWKGWLWDKYMWIHGFIGFFVTISTLVFGMIAWFYIGWEFLKKTNTSI